MEEIIAYKVTCWEWDCPKCDHSNVAYDKESVVWCEECDEEFSNMKYKD